MALSKKLAYMGVGAVVILLLVFGGAAIFAQDETGAAAVGRPAAAPVGGELAHPGDGRPAPGTYLAEALGVSTEALAAAQEEVRLAGIEAALEQELITEVQAEWMRERVDRGAGPLPGHLPFPVEAFDFDAEAALAEALGIDVQALAAARDEAAALALAARVEAGDISAEEAELISARRAVRDYFDRDALEAVLSEMYGEAVAEAEAAGAITPAQAELLLENAPAFERFGPDGGRPGPGGGGRGPSGFAPGAPGAPRTPGS